MNTPIILWHDSQRWEGPLRKGGVEYGPDLYLTTSVGTACKYAKGGGSVIRFEIEPDLRWLENARIHSVAMTDWVKDRARPLASPLRWTPQAQTPDVVDDERIVRVIKGKK